MNTADKTTELNTLSLPRCVLLACNSSPLRLISASSCWGSSDNRSYWRGWWGWRSNQTPPCSWRRGSRTPWTGCNQCARGTSETAPGQAADEVRFSLSYFRKVCTCLIPVSRSHSPAEETWGIVSTKGTFACEGRRQPGRSKSTSLCEQRCWPGRWRTLWDVVQTEQKCSIWVMKYIKNIDNVLKYWEGCLCWT